MGVFLVCLFAIAVRQGFGLPASVYGTIRPVDELAVSNSITNLGEQADYTFRFLPDTAIPAGGFLDIQFPGQFSLGLGLSSPPVCSSTCTVANRTVTITLGSGLAQGSQNSVVVYSVLNPTNPGGTGSFMLKSRAMNNVLDMNLVFGTIGVENAVTAMTYGSVAISSTSSTNAGLVGIYQFSFTPNRLIPKFSWLSFIFPNNGFQLALYPSCQSYSINGQLVQGILTCVTTGRTVKLTGISQDVQAATEIGIAITVTNPPQSGATGYFTIETGRNLTNTVYERISTVPGVKIDPGLINNKYLSQTNPQVMLTRGNIVLYTLKFTPSNPVEAGGTIAVVFNNNFNMDTTSHYWVNYGLQDKSVTTGVICAYALNTQTLTISGFAQFTPVEISLQLELVNPIMAGQTPALQILTYKADGLTIIDQDTSVSVTILSTTAATITPTFLGSSMATGVGISLQFTFTPNVQVPALGYIKAYLPSGFGTSTPFPTCNIKPKNVTLLPAPLCTLVDGLLTLQLFGVAGGLQPGTGDFMATLDSYIQITTGLVAPSLAGFYVFNFMTYDQNSVLLESATCGLTLLANDFAVFNFDSAHSETNTPNIILISFTPLVTVPQGSPQASVTSQQGFIEVNFPTMDALGNLQFPLALGLGVSSGQSVPCNVISGMTVVVGLTFNCVLSNVPSVASANNYATVTISNFQAITPGTAVTLHLPGVTHTLTAVSIPVFQVYTYYKQNRLRVNLNKMIAAIVTPPTVLGTPQIDGVNLFTTTVTTVATATALSGKIKTVTAISGVSTNFLIQVSTTHDNGYCAATPTLFCSVAGINYPCVCEPQVDMILITVGAVAYIAGNTYPFVLTGIINPGSVPVAADKVTVYTISSQDVMDQITYTHFLPIQTPGFPAAALVVPSSSALSDVNVAYTITVSAGHSIPAGGYVAVLFPITYSLNTSTPACTCVASTLTTSGLTCGLFGVTVTAINVPAIPATNLITMNVYGVKNPSSGATSGSFTVGTWNAAGLLIDYNNAVTGFTYTAAVQTTGVLIVSLIPFPANAQANSELAITLVGSKPVPKGGVISLIFPAAQYPELPSSLSCKLTGALTTFQSFTISGSMLSVTLDSPYINGFLTVTAMGLTNFDAGNSGAFNVLMTYDGFTLSQTATLTTATTAPAAALLNVLNWDFYPRNEGETATYEFEVSPQYNITSNQAIVVGFPIAYDKRVGDNLQCYSDSLPGYLACTVSQVNYVTITGQEGFTTCVGCSFTISIYGVKNPTIVGSASLGYLSIGLLSNGNTYTELNQAVGPVALVSAPGYNNLWTVLVSSLYSRMPNQMQFNMTTSQSIPQTSFRGAVWLQFPGDYSLGGSNITCTSSIIWADGVPDCSLYYNRVVVSGQAFDYSGLLLLNLTNVPNPLTQVTSGSVVAKTYDGINMIVLDSSYPNLNPNEFNYVYPGPLIVINGDAPILAVRGTMTSDVLVTLSFPCALNITLVPTLGDFCLVPYNVEIYIGQVSASFRISVPLYLTPGTYYITWQLSGEVYPPYYTPVSQTTLIVQSNSALPVNIDSITPVPQGGTSLPVRVWVTNAPDVNMTVSIAIPSGYKGLSLNQTTLQFCCGATQLFFLLSAANTTLLNPGVLTLSLSGPSASIYVLSQPNPSFAITTHTPTFPIITSVSSATITRATASFYLRITKISKVYYQCALRGTPPPTFFNAKTGGPALYASSMSQFGQTTIGSSLTTSLTIQNLVAGTLYTLYLWAEDTEGKSSAAVVTHDFSTAPVYRAAIATMNFLQTYMTQIDIDNALNAVKLLLSLDQSRVVSNGVTPGSSSGRRLGVASSILSFYITDEPTSDVYPTPKTLANLLGSKTSQLASMLSNFDSSWVIAGNEVVMGQCRFVQSPKVTSTWYANITVSASLAGEGYIYATCVDPSSSQVNPTSNQVSLGLDSTNSPVPAFSAHVLASQSLNYTFTGKSASTLYKVYVSCGNIYPGAPQLLPDANVISVSVQTPVKPAAVPILLVSGMWKVLTIVVLGMLV